MSEHPASPLFRLYDPLFEGCGLAPPAECDLRALARVFDIEAAADVPPARIWMQLKPRILKHDAAT